MTRTASSLLACLAVAGALSLPAAGPAEAGMLTRAAAVAAMGYGIRRGAETCLSNPDCRERVASVGSAALSRGLAACGGSAACMAGATRAAGALGNLARDGGQAFGGRYGLGGGPFGGAGTR